MTQRIDFIEDLIRKGSVDPFVWYSRAMELRAMGHLAEALRAFEDVRERFGTYVATYLMAAQVAHELGQTEQARAWTQQGLEVARAKGDHHTYGELQGFLATLGS
jgi:tetratricopeptide (TPR) repeat protein